MAPADGSATLRVSVAYSPAPGEVDEVTIELPQGSTVGEALRASGLLARHPGIALETQAVGVWGKVKALDEILRERDRVEVFRPLKVDPKEARRQRYRKHRDPV